MHDWLRVRVNGVTLRVLDEGSGPPVLLLHGFPDSAQLWRGVRPGLRDAGYRLIVPDLRGFGASDKPGDVAAYTLARVLDDLTELLDTMGARHPAVVGHDWGAAVAWALAARCPERVDRLAALSVGHPGGFFTAGIEQRRRSWYVLLFQHEGVAEEALRADDWRLLRELLHDSPDLGRYVAELSRPHALEAGLAWYRANITPESFGRRMPLTLPSVTCPVLGIWSTGDPYLTEEQMAASAAYCCGPWRYERIVGAGHWIPLDAPDRLTALLVEFLSAADPTRGGSRILEDATNYRQ
jgi:pimeloyl-ACP methyl ester carboxylesterase